MPGPRRADDPGRARLGVRVVLVAGIVAALAGLVALGVVAWRMFRPAGAPEGAALDRLEWVRSLHGFGPAADEQLDEPTAVAVAPNGDVYVNDPQRARVMRFRPDGSFRSLVHTGAGGTGKGQFVRPAGLAVDRQGYLYIADPVAGKVIVFDPGDEYVREWPAERPLGLAVQDDAVFVLTNGSVTVYSATGKRRGAFGNRGREPQDIDAYQGICTKGREVYIADALNQRVKAFDVSGDLRWVSPSSVPTRSAPAPDATETSFTLPQDIVMDGAGRLVVVDAFAFELVVLDAADGSVLSRYGSVGTGDGQFFYPTGIDYDPVRDWFVVADTRNDRVQIVRIPGSGASPAAAVRRLGASPYLYCLPPVLLAVVVLISYAVLRVRRASVSTVGDE